MTVPGYLATAAETDAPALAEPTVVRIDATGVMTGHNGSYDKFLRDMAGVYQDAAAFAAEIAAGHGGTLVYRVEENRVGSGSGALVLGTSTVLPGRIGEEFALTRGHLHRVADRAEVYHCLAGRGVMLLESLDGRSRAIELNPGDAVHVPGHWIHRSVNIGPEPMVTAFVYNEDAGQDYDLIAQAGGTAQLVVPDRDAGWRTVANPNHRGYRANAA